MELEESMKVTELLKDVETVMAGFELGSHIGLTDLQRKTDWRKEFDKAKMVEILDRNELFAVMLKPDVFQSMRKYITVLEEQLEQLQLDALFVRRENKMNWTTGEDLKQKAKESLHARADLIRGLLDGDK